MIFYTMLFASILGGLIVKYLTIGLIVSAFKLIFIGTIISGTIYLIYFSDTSDNIADFLYKIFTGKNRY